MPQVWPTYPRVVKSCLAALEFANVCCVYQKFSTFDDPRFTYPQTSNLNRKTQSTSSVYSYRSRVYIEINSPKGRSEKSAGFLFIPRTLIILHQLFHLKTNMTTANMLTVTIEPSTTMQEKLSIVQEIWNLSDTQEEKLEQFKELCRQQALYTPAGKNGHPEASHDDATLMYDHPYHLSLSIK